MYVIGGTAKGRKLLSVPGDDTRPVLSRVRTSLFDILRPELPGMSVLDLFAGTGSVGIEALSQGAASCDFVDMSKKSSQTILQNLQATKLADKGVVHNSDAFYFLRRCQKSFNLIYNAPPQYKGIWCEALLAIAERPHLLKPNGVVVSQIDPKEYQEVTLTALSLQRRDRYGNTLLLWHRKIASAH